MTSPQPGILADVPPVSRYLSFQLAPGADPAAALARLAKRRIDDALVVGIGPSLVARMGHAIDGLHELAPLVGPGIGIPSTPVALWIWLRGEDHGAVLPLARELVSELGDALEVTRMIESFRHGSGRDLSGYEDGTENPKDDAAIEAAITRGRGAGLDGSSFVAVQEWEHQLARLASFTEHERDHVFGRRRSDNVELADAPESAHVKRGAQESFEPTAFMVRRSMAFTDANSEGLVFVAFGRSLDAFERVLHRMVGLEDGIVDGLFRFTRPRTGCACWCPPMKDGRLDLSAIGVR